MSHTDTKEGRSHGLAHFFIDAGATSRYVYTPIGRPCEPSHQSEKETYTDSCSVSAAKAAQLVSLFFYLLLLSSQWKTTQIEEEEEAKK